MGPHRYLLKSGLFRGIKEFFNADLIRTLLSSLRGPFSTFAEVTVFSTVLRCATLLLLASNYTQADINIVRVQMQRRQQVNTTTTEHQFSLQNSINSNLNSDIRTFLVISGPFPDLKKQKGPHPDLCRENRTYLATLHLIFSNNKKRIFGKIETFFK